MKNHLILVLLAGLLFGGTQLTQAAQPSATRPVSVDRVDDLIAQGRTKLAAADYKGAKTLFDEAATADKSSLRTQVWQLRVGMQLEPLNDVLGRIDALAKGHDGPAMQYLYGMAFAVKAQQALDAGLSDGTIGMQMADAQTFLSQALEHDGELYSDAFPVLARVAWMNQDLDAAIAAADKAVGYYPNSASSWGQRGRIQLSRFLASKDDDDTLEAAQEMSEDSVRSFERGLAILAEESRESSATARAQLYEQLAICQAWRGDMSASAEAYAACMGWDPSVLDFGSIWNTLGGSFMKTLEDGEAQFVARWGTATQSDATMLWYLGYARYMALKDKEFNQAFIAEFEKVEEELTASVQKWPAYSNALWYVALSRYARSDFVGAAETLVEFWERDPNATVATLAGDLERGKPRIEWIIGQCAGEGRLLEAAALSGILAEIDPPGALNWSYKALFLRDYADNIVRRKPKKAEDPEIIGFYEQSLAAYERALEIEPDNPNFMNDLAVVLHYNLNRDLERALALYDRAREAAQKLMDDPEVDEQLKVDFISIALRDSKNNAGLLRKQLEKAKKAREEAERKKKEEEAGA